MDQRALPDPAVLRRRHEALLGVEELGATDHGDHRYYGAEPPHHFWFDNGSGDSYDLVIEGDDALLTAFDHESPRSPWGREDGAAEWPGMFDGMPDRLRRFLPDRDDDEPMSVSACFWFIDGTWHEGQPEPIPDEDDVYRKDPGGAAGLLTQLLDPEAEVRELVGYVYEQPARIDEALILLRRLSIE